MARQYMLLQSYEPLPHHSKAMVHCMPITNIAIVPKTHWKVPITNITLFQKDNKLELAGRFTMSSVVKFMLRADCQAVNN